MLAAVITPLFELCMLLMPHITVMRRHMLELDAISFCLLLIDADYAIIFRHILIFCALRYYDIIFSC